MDPLRRIGENFRRWREECGLARAAAAARADLTESEIGAIEHGQVVPAWDRFLKLAAVYGVRPGVFFDGVEWNQDRMQLVVRSAA